MGLAPFAPDDEPDATHHGWVVWHIPDNAPDAPVPPRPLPQHVCETGPGGRGHPGRRPRGR
jgi:hypothetical protein